MSYKVEQKIGGKIYVYEATNHWDKKKKQSRQTRKYIGVKDAGTGEVSTPRKNRWGVRMSMDAGAVHVLIRTAAEMGLGRTLEEAFGKEDAGKIFALAAFCATENAPMYLFPDWAGTADGMEQFSMSSQQTSFFMNRLGDDEYAREVFWKKWAKLHGEKRNIVFDITSISSYASHEGLQEFGYNRDGESLPQINMGMIYGDDEELPLGYRIYQGSIGDVSTLKNLLSYLKKDLKLGHARILTDRGFYSGGNLKDMIKNGFRFIIPLPFSTSEAKRILSESMTELHSASKLFSFGERTLAHTVKVVDLAAGKFDAHVFYDRKREIDELSNLTRKLELVEERVNGTVSADTDEALKAIDKIAKGIAGLFRIDMAKGHVNLLRDNDAIEKHAMKFGKIILLSSEHDIGKREMVSDYFRRDGVEKFFDAFKNEMDGNRFRVHSQNALEGRLFIQVVALILHSSIMARLKKSKLHKKMTFPEIISNLKRLRRFYSEDGTSVLGEISRRQREILCALNFPIKPE